MSGGGPGGNMFGGGGGGGKLDRSISPLGEPPPLVMRLTLLKGVMKVGLAPFGVESPGEELGPSVVPPLGELGETGETGAVGTLV